MQQYQLQGVLSTVNGIYYQNLPFPGQKLVHRSQPFCPSVCRVHAFRKELWDRRCAPPRALKLSWITRQKLLNIWVFF